MSTVPTQDMKTAHLPPQDIYHFTVADADEREGTSKLGEPYTYVLVRLTLDEAYGACGGEAGRLARPVTVFERFYTRGKALAKFTSFFRSITGYIPSGELNPDTGKNEASIPEMLDEIKGGSAWGVYRHSGEGDDGTAFGNFGYQFSDDPSKLRAPQPVAA